MPGGRPASGAAPHGLGLTQGPALRRTSRLDCSAVTGVKFLHGGSQGQFLWSRKSRTTQRTPASSPQEPANTRPWGLYSQRHSPGHQSCGPSRPNRKQVAAGPPATPDGAPSLSRASGGTSSSENTRVPHAAGRGTGSKARGMLGPDAFWAGVLGRSRGRGAVGRASSGRRACSGEHTLRDLWVSLFSLIPKPERLSPYPTSPQPCPGSQSAHVQFPLCFRSQAAHEPVAVGATPHKLSFDPS